MNFPEGKDVERFRDLVKLRLGLQFDDTRLGELAEILGRRLQSTGQPSALYLSRLGSVLGDGECRALANELTVRESYFFRNIEQFRALSEVAIPARVAAQGGSRRLRILSAGCASGDEAYSIAILARELAALEGWTVSIRGVDVSSAAIEKASSARYAPWSLRETPADVQKRFFRQDGREAVLDSAIRAMVTFAEGNLTEEDPALWQPETYDIVFCRNVLMYLSPTAAQGLTSRISRSLAPGGYLFLGHAETLRRLSRDFHLRHTNETFYYQRRELAEGPSLAPEEPEPDAAAQRLRDPLAGISTDDSWVESIQRASERIQFLTSAAPPASAPKLAGAGERARADIEPAFELLRREQYAEATAALGRLPREASRDPDALLLKAVLLTHGGDLTEAEHACRDLLANDEMNAGAHYLMALCREHAGSPTSAVEHDQIAAYIDPGFAMPRLHMGLLSRRAGDHGSARRELEQAVALLEREDPSRLLLFGGGFEREALVALCRAELARCEGRS